MTTSDVLMTTIGTAGIISTAYESFRENPQGKLQVFCNVIPGRWHAMGVTLAAGGSLAWALEVLGGAEAEVAEQSGLDAYELISREAEKSSVGAGGIVFLPYLIGERCPHVDPSARGAFVGLSLTSRKRDLYRSVLEGVIFSFRDVSEIFSSLGRDFRYIATSGGGAQSPLWRQIHADIFKKRVITVSGSIGGGLRRGPGGRGGAEGLAELRDGLPAAGDRDRHRPQPGTLRAVRPALRAVPQLLPAAEARVHRAVRRGRG